MLLTYVDESYSRDVYWIAALLCPDDEAISLTAALDEVVLKAATTFDSIDSHAELHGHDLFQGKHDWQALHRMVRARIGVYNDTFEAIGAHNVEVIFRGVNVPRLQQRYSQPDHPHAVALSHLLERVDERAEERDERVLVIADEVDQADAYRRSLWHFQRYSTSGYKARRLRRIVDTIHFAPSSASRLVQAADLVAFLHARMSARRDLDARAKRANDALWGRIAHRVVHQWCWDP